MTKEYLFGMTCQMSCNILALYTSLELIFVFVIVIHVLLYPVIYLRIMLNLGITRVTNSGIINL